MIHWPDAFFALIVYPNRRKGRDCYGLEVYVPDTNGDMRIVNFPRLPKDIADRCLFNVVFDLHGDEVEYGVMHEVIEEMVTDGVPYVEH